MPRFLATTGAIALLFLFLTIVVTGVAAMISALLAVILGAYSLVSLVAWKRNAKYDLNLLREVHEAGGAADVELPEIPEDAGVLCRYCGEPYAEHLLNCPRCGRSPMMGL